MDDEDGGDGGGDDKEGIGEDDGDVGVGVGQVAGRRRAPFQSGWAVCAALDQVVVWWPWRRPHSLCRTGRTNWEAGAKSSETFLR